MSRFDVVVLEIGQTAINYGYDHTSEPYGRFQSDVPDSHHFLSVVFI